MVDGKAVVTVTDNAITGFVIMHDWTNSVIEVNPNASATRIVSVSPNPVSENTTIEFELLNSGNVTIQVVDLIGNELMTLTNDVMTSGTYHINWDGKLTDGNQISSGQYMLRLVSGKVTSVYPIVIVK
jgi:flagellar hook assembly protein FlgD